MNSLRPAIALVVLLAASPSGAEDVPGGFSDEEDDIESVEDTAATKLEAWVQSIDATIRLNRDPALRAIVCRVPYTDLTIEALARATKLSPVQILSAFVELRNMKLVTTGKAQDGEMLIRPKSEDTRARMRHWAEYWCARNDECGVAK